MEYMIIAIIVLILLTATVGFIIRQKHRKIISELERKKHQIQNKPILEELTKVKALNMNGQTEEMFERWRNTWNEIMDVDMPKIDTLLFDADDLVDRFRFMGVKAVERDIEQRIHMCDKEMNHILEELSQLIGSEEKNRIEIEQIKEQYRAARKTLLAHPHSFGQAIQALENRLEMFVPKFEEYDDLTEKGNYLQAREIVISLNTEGQKLFHLLHDIPTLLSELQTKIPANVQELRNGQKEMEAQSYYLEHLEMTAQLNIIEADLVKLKEQLIELNIAPVKSRVEEIMDELDAFYDLLEKEVLAKNFVDQHREQTEQRLTEVTSITKVVEEEATYVRQSYHLSEKEAEIPKICMQQLQRLQNRYELLAARALEEQSAYSSLKEELEEISEELERLFEEQDRFADSLKNLRIDENKARTKLDELKRMLHETDRMLHKANLPGIPDEMNVRLEEAEEHVFIVMQSLQEVPLNMSLVHNYLDNAEKCIQEVYDKTKEMLENVLLIERIIQYGNRYRATHPQMHERLLEAEEAFRQFRYAKALEDAATAVESVEPGAMKRIEVLVKDDVWRS